MSDEEKLRRSLALKGRKKSEGMREKLKEHWRKLREEDPEKLEQISKKISETTEKRFETEESRQIQSDRVRAALERRREEIPGYAEAWASRARKAGQLSADKRRKNKS